MQREHLNIGSRFQVPGVLGFAGLAEGEAEGAGIGCVDVDQPCVVEPLGPLPAGLQPLLLLQGAAVVGGLLLGVYN